MSFRDILSRFFGVSDQRVLIGDPHQLPAVPAGARYWGDPDLPPSEWTGPAVEFSTGPTDYSSMDRADRYREDREQAAAQDEAEVAGDDAEAAADLYPTDADYYTPATYTPASYGAPAYTPGNREATGDERERDRAEQEAEDLVESELDKEQREAEAYATERERERLRAWAPAYHGAVDPTTGLLAYNYEDAEAYRENWVDEQLAKRAARETAREEREAAPAEAGDAGESVEAPQGWYAQGAQAYWQLAQQARDAGRDEQAEVLAAYAGQFERLHDEREVDAAIETTAAEDAEKHEREAREYRAAAEALPRDSDTVDRMLAAAKQHEEEAQLFRMVAESATAAQEAIADAWDAPLPDTSRPSQSASRDDTCAGY